MASASAKILHMCVSRVWLDLDPNYWIMANYNVMEKISWFTREIWWRWIRVGFLGMFIHAVDSLRM